MPETTKIWNKQEETKERAKTQGEINTNSQLEVSGTTELTENDAPHICVIETTRVFSPNSNLLKVDIKMIISKTSDI